MPRRIAIFYLTIASLWILLSDAALEWMAPSLIDIFYISKVKGIFFVAITALLLYLYGRREQAKSRKIELGYTELFLRNPNPMWLSRQSDDRIIAANKNACRLYGYSESEFKTLRASDLRTNTPPIQGFEADYECHKNAAGEERWVKYFCSQMTMQGEELDIHMVISADATMEAEAKRLEAQTSLSNLLNTMDDYVFGVNNQGFFTVANPAFEAYVGQGELIGRQALEVLDRDGSDAWQQLLSSIATDQRYHAEWHDINRNVWLRIKLYDTAEGLGGYASNITEHKQLRNTILKYENTLKSIANATEDMIWAFDADFRLLTSNTSFDLAHLLKRGIRLSVGDLIVPEHPALQTPIQPWIDAYRQSLQGKSVEVVIHETDHRNKAIIFNLRCYPILNEAAEVICVGCFAHDITKRTIHEMRIERQNKRLLEIAWIQSHELRAPLANVLGLLELIKIDQSSAEMREAYLHKLEAEALALDAIIHKVVAKSVLPIN